MTERIREGFKALLVGVPFVVLVTAFVVVGYAPNGQAFQWPLQPPRP